MGIYSRSLNSRGLPVRVDKNTIILVREGLNVEEHLKRFKDKDNTPPGYIPWF